MLLVVPSTDWKDSAGLSPITPLVCHEEEVAGKLPASSDRVSQGLLMRICAR